ncbi:MAG: molybdopterin dehydrogenase [Rhodospirillaceae bacterium]|nr:molybdopterin dehydrogenase [Rhodospirillaceae bacterium]
MKAAAFDYKRPDTLEAVLAELAEVGDEGLIIAGGQTLVPLMAMRLVRPSLLIDINHVSELSGIKIDGDMLVIKACTRQVLSEQSHDISEAMPLLAKGIRHVGHTQTRNRGTVGGSLANADPSAEIPIVAQNLDAILVSESAKGERNIDASDFFFSAMDTALEDDECLKEVRFPIWRDQKVGTGFQEVSIRASDYAIVAAAAQLGTDSKGICSRAAVTVGGCAPVAKKIKAVSDVLVGSDLSDAVLKEAAHSVIGKLEPESDVHATAAYRKRVAGQIVERSLFEARAEVFG